MMCQYLLSTRAHKPLAIPLLLWLFSNTDQLLRSTNAQIAHHEKASLYLQSSSSSSLSLLYVLVSQEWPRTAADALYELSRIMEDVAILNQTTRDILQVGQTCQDFTAAEGERCRWVFPTGASGRGGRDLALGRFCGWVRVLDPGPLLRRAW